MRSLLAALAVLVLSVALLARTSEAGPPPASETRELKPVIEALQKSNGLKGALATARWYAEVLGGQTVSVYAGSGPEQVAFGAIGPAEAAISARECGPLTPVELKAASAILAEFGDALPLTLRAYTLGQQPGKTDKAAELFAAYVEAQMPSGPCPGEHPSTSGRRLGQMGFGLRCVQKFAPKRDVSRLLKLIERAQECARTNTAVG
jgi:hypothetical protein